MLTNLQPFLQLRKLLQLYVHSLTSKQASKHAHCCPASGGHAQACLNKTVSIASIAKHGFTWDDSEGCDWVIDETVKDAQVLQHKSHFSVN